MSQYPATTTGFATGAEPTNTYHTTQTAHTTTASNVQTRGQNVHTSKKPVALFPLLGLAFAGWAIYVGGLAALQHQCPGAPVDNTALLNGVDGFSSFVLPCSKVYRWAWFLMAFELVIMLTLLVSVAAGRLWHTRLAFITLFAVATVLFMLQTERFLTVSSVNPWYSSGGSSERRNWVTFSGALILVVANILIILALGIDNTVDHTGQSVEGYGHGHGHKV